MFIKLNINNINDKFNIKNANIILKIFIKNLK